MFTSRLATMFLLLFFSPSNWTRFRTRRRQSWLNKNFTLLGGRLVDKSAILKQRQASSGMAGAGRRLGREEGFLSSLRHRGVRSAPVRGERKNEKIRADNNTGSASLPHGAIASRCRVDPAGLVSQERRLSSTTVMLNCRF